MHTLFMQPSTMTDRTPFIRGELVLARQRIEVTEVILVFREQEVEEAETGEATRSNREAEVRTAQPTVPIAIIAMRKAISGPTVPKYRKIAGNKTRVGLVRNQTILRRTATGSSIPNN